MGLVQSLTGKILISGPAASYQLDQQEDGSCQIEFAEQCNVTDEWKRQTDAYCIDSPTGNRLVVIRICTTNDIPRFTLVYSHSRDMDVGSTFNSAAKFVADFDCDSVVWDYASYGASVGDSSESNLKADSCAVMEFVTKELRVRARQVVCLGESLGSVAALKQASEFRVAGVVLLGAFESIVRKVMGTGCHLPCLRCFDNRQLIKRVNQPVLIVHGRQDEVLSRRHPKVLHGAAPNKEKRLEFLDNCKHMGCGSHPGFPPIFRSFLEETLWL